MWARVPIFWSPNEINLATRMTADGHTYRSVAQRLGRSYRATIEFLKKLDIKTVKTQDPCEVWITLPRATVDLIDQHRALRHMSRARFIRMVLLVAARSNLFDAIIDDGRKIAA
jgi:hypothetical protein